MTQVVLRFSGGLETLFEQTCITINFPIENGTVSQLVVWIRDNLVRGKPSFFCDGDSIRPGLLIIVNGVDYLITGDDYVLKEMDEVDFISVLHGG